jgi:hypothetical protein
VGLVLFFTSTAAASLGQYSENAYARRSHRELTGRSRYAHCGSEPLVRGRSSALHHVAI